MSVGTSMRLLSCVQQLVSDYVLGPSELFTTNITRVLVVVLRAVGLHVLGQFAHLCKLFTTLATRKASDLVIIEARTRGSISGLTLGPALGPQPALRPCRQCQSLETIVS